MVHFVDSVICDINTATQGQTNSQNNGTWSMNSSFQNIFFFVFMSKENNNMNYCIMMVFIFTKSPPKESVHLNQGLVLKNQGVYTTRLYHQVLQHCFGSSSFGMAAVLHTPYFPYDPSQYWVLCSTKRWILSSLIMYFWGRLYVGMLESAVFVVVAVSCG